MKLEGSTNGPEKEIHPPRVANDRIVVKPTVSPRPLITVLWVLFNNDEPTVIEFCGNIYYCIWHWKRKSPYAHTYASGIFEYPVK